MTTTPDEFAARAMKRADKVLEAVCHVTGVLPADIRGPSRSKTVMRARQALVWFLTQHLFMSSTEIGHYISRDHSTVLNARERAPFMKDWETLHALVTVRLQDMQEEPKADVVYVSFHGAVVAHLKELLETGLYGNTMAEVVDRLVCQRLQQLLKG